MLLLLIRHAAAAVRDPETYPDDTLRPLVPKGKKAARRIARQLLDQGIVPTVILSSPWRRAWQTAGILAEEMLADKSARTACDDLARDPNLESLAKVVGTRQPTDVVALVGHEPWMSDLGSLLLTGSPTRLSIEFPKAAVLGIDVEQIAPAAGKLRFFLRP